MTKIEALKVLINKSSIADAQKEELLLAADKLTEEEIDEVANALANLHNQEAEKTKAVIEQVDELIALEEQQS